MTFRRDIGYQMKYLLMQRLIRLAVSVPLMWVSRKMLLIQTRLKTLRVES